MGLLDGDIADLVSNGLEAAGLPYDLTLARIEPGTPDPSEPWVPVQESLKEYPCRGFVDKWSAFLVSQGLVNRDDARIVIIGNSLDMSGANPERPRAGDRIVARGRAYTVIRADPDPALATWEVQAR